MQAVGFIMATLYVISLSLLAHQYFSSRPIFCHENFPDSSMSVYLIFLLLNREPDVQLHRPIHLQTVVPQVVEENDFVPPC